MSGTDTLEKIRQAYADAVREQPAGYPALPAWFDPRVPSWQHQRAGRCNPAARRKWADDDLTPIGTRTI